MVLTTHSRSVRGDMAIPEQAGSSGTLVEVLDRVLDKGVVIDAWARLSVVGIDLLNVDTRIVVASVETYLQPGPILGPNGALDRSLHAAEGQPR